jgi:hypothetical protein
MCPLQKLCVMMESVWHLQRLCSTEPLGTGVPQASGRLQCTFVQQLRGAWFRQGQGSISGSVCLKGDAAIESALEVPRDTLFKAAQEVSGCCLSIWTCRLFWSLGM